jgi:bacterioferritin-associated ferredoxin
MDKELINELIGSFCVCYNITYKEINDFILNNKNVKSVADVKHYFVCGLNCKKCIPDIQKIIDYHKK